MLLKPSWQLSPRPILSNTDTDTEVAEVGVYLWIQESYVHCCHGSDNWVIGTNSKQSVSVTRKTQKRVKRNTSGNKIFKRSNRVLANGTILILGCICRVFIDNIQQITVRPALCVFMCVFVCLHVCFCDHNSAQP